MGPPSLRLLVAGDRSQAGKSTVSLGILAALIESGIPASELAYIKPATQCVSSTLTARYCESLGISYEHIGPLVFYRGFTRQHLDKCDTTNHAVKGRELVRRCGDATKRISEGKRITIIDGVGYPSVGSIVGCSSADLAIACRAPVLLVGKTGVGDAVDSFNLCARFFEAQNIPVLGVVFNKLPLVGFYNRDKCASYIRKYMAAARPRQRAYGFIPVHEALSTLSREEQCSFAFKRSLTKQMAGPLTDDDKKAIELVKKLFREHVETNQLLVDLEAALARPADWMQELPRF